MGIMEAIKNNEANRSANRTVATSNADRPQAQTWINIGYEANGRFINLPLGLALDTQQPIEVRGQDKDWVALQKARNELLTHLQALGDELEPGAEIAVNLEVRIRHVMDKVEISTDDNQFSMGNAGFSLVAKRTEVPVEAEQPEGKQKKSA